MRANIEVNIANEWQAIYKELLFTDEEIEYAQNIVLNPNVNVWNQLGNLLEIWFGRVWDLKSAVMFSIVSIGHLALANYGQIINGGCDSTEHARDWMMIFCLLVKISFLMKDIFNESNEKNQKILKKLSNYLEYIIEAAKNNICIIEANLLVIVGYLKAVELSNHGESNVLFLSRPDVYGTLNEDELLVSNQKQQGIIKRKPGFVAADYGIASVIGLAALMAATPYIVKLTLSVLAVTISVSLPPLWIPAIGIIIGAAILKVILFCCEKNTTPKETQDPVDEFIQACNESLKPDVLVSEPDEHDRLRVLSNV